jgi:YbbR domain-containing protein
VRRLLGRIVHNWPLKLAAVGLASLMYGGLALSQNTQTYVGVVQVRVVNQPPDTVLLANPAPVTSIRYFAPSGVPVAASSFVATVDLTGVVPEDGLATAPIRVDAIDGRIRVLGYDPAFASIPLEPLKEKEVPVKVEYGVVPDGLTLGEISVVPKSVIVSGPESIILRVESARADVLIQTTGIDVDQDVPLIPVDKLGNALSPADVAPPTARVTIPVFSDQKSRTLPVNPIITGTPAAGFEIESVTVEPQVALVAGDADQLAELTRVDTEPIPMTGVSADETVEVGLALPTGVVAVGDQPIKITIAIRPVTETRTFSAGLRLLGAGGGLRYTLSVDRVLVTIGGSTAELDRLSAATLVVDLDVTGLQAGVHEVPVTANLPAGTTLVAASPASVTVTITAAAVPSSAPPASGAPSPSPSGG